MARFAFLLVFLVLVSLTLGHPAFAQTTFGFEDDSVHYVVIGQIAFDGIAPAVGRFMAIDVNFKPIPSSYWNNTITVLNFTITHYSNNGTKLVQDFSVGSTLNTGSPGGRWTYTTHQYYPPTPYPLTISHTDPGGPWHFKPNSTGSYKTNVVIQLMQPEFPAETYHFSFNVVSPNGTLTTSTLTTTLVLTQNVTTTSTELRITSEPPSYLAASVILVIALVATILWAILGRRKLPRLGFGPLKVITRKIVVFLPVINHWNCHIGTRS
jgi:hypothetical protein